MYLADVCVELIMASCHFHFEVFQIEKHFFLSQQVYISIWHCPKHAETVTVTMLFKKKKKRRKKKKIMTLFRFKPSFIVFSISHVTIHRSFNDQRPFIIYARHIFSHKPTFLKLDIYLLEKCTFYSLIGLLYTQRFSSFLSHKVRWFIPLETVNNR